MALEYTNTAVRGANEQAKEDVQVPEEYRAALSERLGLNAFGAGTSVRKWGEQSTDVEMVDVAYDRDGDSEDLDEFVVSEKDKMVVTEEGRERIAMVSAQFNPVQTEDVMDVFAKVLEDFNLQSCVIGEARDYGSMAALDLYVVNKHTRFENPDLDNHLSFGLEVRNSHDAKESIRVRPFARDGHCRNTMRALTDWKNAVHRKPEGEEEKPMRTAMYRMFAEALFELGYLASSIVEDIRRSSETYVEFDNDSITLRDFYETWLPSNTPQKILESSVKRAHLREGNISSISQEPPEDPTLSVWSIVSGFTYALEHESNMSDGYNRDRYHRKVRDALSAPEAFGDEIKSEYLQEQIDFEGRAAELEAMLTDD